MRWATKNGAIGACAITLGYLTSGCAAVLEAAAQHPEAIVFLPVAAVVEGIALAARAAAEDKKPSNGMISVSLPAVQSDPLAYRNWQDPDDWVAACDGPMMCGEHEHFSCAGTPGDCYCDCVGNLAINP